MRFDSLQEGTLLRRYKRFLADVQLPGGEIITAHCPNTGAMTGCAEPGSRVWLSRSASKTRKYPHTWELVDTGAGLACVHSAKANAVVREAFEAGLIPGFKDYPELRSEVKYGAGSRIDLLLTGATGTVYVEVKSVTLLCREGLGVFPDAVSERGRKHLRELACMVQVAAARAVVFFCVFHSGIDHVSAAGNIDPTYRTALIDAQAAGVEVLAWRAKVETTGIELVSPLPFSIDPPA
ncbi:MAG: DNA/RNA nuclease SfsA [Halioglobus sp.]|nr:DNA/RNA nuclease SfsA [Halioglobus sp.]